ncbi:MAG: ABC transporter permease [Candidatus Aminicenantes bacterium]|nr:ABC transporter permease [Candidatus Aminicenantes bacterium]
MKKGSPSPGKWAERFLSFLTQSGERTSITGDFAEIFKEKVANHGVSKARIWYWYQAFRSLPMFLRNRTVWILVMVKTFFTFSLRNLKKNKILSLINLTGLSVSIGLLLLVLLFVRSEWRVDRFQEHYDRICRLEYNDSCVMPSGILPLLEGKIPEIQNTVRLDWPNKTVAKYKEEVYSLNRTIFADPSLFQVFTLPLIQGDAASALSAPFNVILTESTACRIFGTENPVGCRLRIDERYDFTVTGVLRDIKDFHFPFDAAASFPSIGKMFGQKALTLLYDGFQHPTYILLQNKESLPAAAAKINTTLKKELKLNFTGEFKLRPLKDIYFYSKTLLGDQYHLHGSLQAIRIFLAAAVLIILMAAVNFINLTTSKAIRRAKEVGLKKVVGSSRAMLASQFLLEAVLLSVFALVTGFLTAQILLPLFSHILDKPLDLSAFLRGAYPFLLIGGSLLLGLAAGIYPAFVMSSFRPADVLRGHINKTGSGIGFRKALIIFQFSMATLLILASLVVFKQLRFMKNANLGFDKENILFLDLNRSLRSRKTAFKNELLRHPRIKDVTFSCRIPGEIMWNWGVEYGGEKKSVFVNAVDPDFIQTYGLRIVEGRNFRWEQNPDKSNRLILNQAAVRYLGMDSPLGQRLSSLPNGNGEGTVIGVLEDYHFNSLHTAIKPEIYYWLDWPHGRISLRLGAVEGGLPRAGLADTISHIKKTWTDFCPNYPFVFSFLDESFDRQYKNEEKLRGLFTLFTVFAVLISCLGLMGLTGHMVENRTKEIGIRKVLGSSSAGIVVLLSREYIRLMFISFLVAFPLGGWFMHRWLQDFAFRTEADSGLFLLAGMISLFVSFLTVVFQSGKAAAASPVRSLRYE